MNREHKEILLSFVESALKHLDNVKDSIKCNKVVKDLDILCIERDVNILIKMIKGES